MRSWIPIAVWPLALVACSDPEPAPPTAAELEAQRIVSEHAAAVLGGHAATPPTAPALEGHAATPTAADELRRFAGFSRDGRRFAYGSASATGGGAACVLWVTEAGSVSADVLTSVWDESDVEQAQQALDDGAFSPDRRPAPPDLSFDANLGDTPPTVTLRRGDRAVTHAIDQAPFPPTDSASIWGVSADGSQVAIELHGPQVDGLLTQRGSETVQFFRVVPMP